MLLLLLLLLASPSSLYFEAKAGGPNPFPQTIGVTGEQSPCVGAGAYEYEASDKRWLWETSNNECSNTPVTVWVDTSSLTPGLYTGAIWVGDLSIPVRLKVTN